MSSKSELKLIVGNDGEVAGRPALITEGEYELRLQYWETSRLFGGRASKLTLWFTVASFGEYHGIRLARYFNVLEVKGKPGRGGRFKAAFIGDLMREYAQLLDPPSRLDRFNLDELRRHIIIGRVETVTRSYKQRDLHEACQYSIVRELVRLQI